MATQPSLLPRKTQDDRQCTGWLSSDQHGYLHISIPHYASTTQKPVLMQLGSLFVINRQWNDRTEDDKIEQLQTADKIILQPTIFQDHPDYVLLLRERAIHFDRLQHLECHWCDLDGSIFEGMAAPNLQSLETTVPELCGPLIRKFGSQLRYVIFDFASAGSSETDPEIHWEPSWVLLQQEAPQLQRLAVRATTLTETEAERILETINEEVEHFPHLTHLSIMLRTVDLKDRGNPQWRADLVKRAIHKRMPRLRDISIQFIHSECMAETRGDVDHEDVERHIREHVHSECKVVYSQTRYI